MENNQNEATEYILYVRDPAMNNSSEIVKVLEDAIHQINEGKCKIKLKAVEEGSIIIHVIVSQGLTAIDGLCKEITMMFNSIFEFDYMNKNCGHHIEVVLAVSDYTINPEMQTTPFSPNKDVKADCTQPSSEIVKEKMASNKPICDPCSKNEQSALVAIKYCTDCEKNLCKNCLNAHSSFKALASHHLINSVLLTKETLLKNYCTKHEEMVIDFFCVDHDCLCCRSCMEETHRPCQKCIPLDVASKGVRRSLMLEEVFSTASGIRETLEKLMRNRDENLKSLNDEEADTLRNLTSIKSKILENLNNLEKKVNSSKTECETQIKSDKKTISQMMESLDEVTSKLNIALKHGSEHQLFILINLCKWQISEMKVRESIKSMFTSTVLLKQSETQQCAVESFWSVHIESTPCPIKYEASKLNHAQVLPITIQMPRKFDFDMRFDLQSTDIVRITSIAVTDDNRLLLCNYTSTKLLVYSERCEYLQDCTLSGKPWDIALIPGEEKAVVSLHNQKSIQFVDIKSLMSGGTHSLPGECRGIAVVGDKICVGGKEEIYTLSKQGKHLTTIILSGGGEISYLHPGPQESVYFINYNKNKVGCVKLNGEVCFTCTPENFNGPRAVTTDSRGNLYVACTESNNIHRLSTDGNVIDVILDRDRTKIRKPFGIAFSRNYQRLYVTNDEGKSVFVFSCS